MALAPAPRSGAQGDSEAQPRLLRHKLLSSGITKGMAAEGSQPVEVRDPLRYSDPPGFWQGYQLRLLSRDGQLLATSTVTASEPAEGRLRLDPALPRDALSAGSSYEIASEEPAPIIAIRYLMGLPLTQVIPPVTVRLGTTRGTNALITRRGARTALVTTRGFGDILLIGYQNRPRLFDLAIAKPAPLFERVVEVQERLSATGEVLEQPDQRAVRKQLEQLRQDGIESVAIVLLHAYLRSDHEQLIERIAREVGFAEVSRSSRVAPLIKIVARGDTTVVDAYLNPVLRGYVESLRESLDRQGRSDLRILTSAGGLVAAEQFIGKDSILSGPAGGVVGFTSIARAAGFGRSIGFDMGGTSTDVSRHDGRYELQYETEKAGVRIVAPMMAIETVAAGGGSICQFDGVKLVVGPASAGADPGPACYGRGGPLTVTDVNLYLGRILSEHFPFALDHDAVQQRLDALCNQIRSATGHVYQPIGLAAGFLQVANANMAKAIRSISIAKGYDPADYVLVAFGGAAPQHACAVAQQLGICQILLHPDAGILSAYGIGMADVVRHRVAAVYKPYSAERLRELDETFRELIAAARHEVELEGIPAERIEVNRYLDLRYQGLEAFLTVAEPRDGSYAQQYEAEHQRRYGYRHGGRPLEIVAARVEVTGRSENAPPASQRLPLRALRADRTTEIYLDGKHQAAGLFIRDRLRPGDTLEGLALIVEQLSTTVVDPQWQAEVMSQGELLLTHRGSSTGKLLSTEADPVQLEIFNNQFAGIAEQMGITLRNTASSVNVKERLDFSCAIFTPQGDLVVNAPHIPVHLGAMSETVKQILADNPQLQPGDVFVTNDPYRGGSHLPDVTVVTPVHDKSATLLFLTASRAHHAEIGGITPGSMPPCSKNLAEEGVLISNFRLVAAGEHRFDELQKLLTSTLYPSRSVADNLADLHAQIAANNQGVQDLLRLVDRYGLTVVQAYMGHIQAAAEQKTRTALRKLPSGRKTFTDYLDDGSPITVAIDVRDGQARIDFTGTGPVLPSNLNANRAIVTAATLYCLRCLIAEEIPLNQGVLAPVTLIIPTCLLNPPRGASPADCAAVVGGNVETSQRVVDVLLGALGVAAASQGTMNNLMFGDASFGYYETICGGSGATPEADGADAVHTHMTNTRLTDPEVLEQRYPVRVREFRIRHGSGGGGRRRGGAGAVRVLEFLRPLQVSILSQRRGPYPPYGLSGGEPGQLGRNILQRAGGEPQELPAMVQLDVQSGDVLTIETPGAGGFGHEGHKE